MANFSKRLGAAGCAVLIAAGLAMPVPARAAAGVDDVIVGLCIWVITESGKRVLECVEEAAGLYQDLRNQQEAEDQADQQDHARDKMKDEKEKEDTIIPVIQNPPSSA